MVASIYHELDDEERYQALHQRQIDLARRLHGDLHPAIIDGLLDDAQYASDRNDYARTENLLQQVDPLIARAGLDRSARRARWWLIGSQSLHPGGATPEKDREALEQAIDLYARFAPAAPGYVHALSTLAFRTVQRDPAQAEKYYLQAIDVAAGNGNQDAGELQQYVYPALAQAREEQGDYAGAERAYAEGADLARKSYGEAHSTTWVPAAQRAYMLHRRGERERAHALFDRLFAVIPPHWNVDSYDDYAREFYAACLAAEGRALEAIPLLEASQRTYIASPGVAHELRRLRLVLGDAYDRVGRTADARIALKASLDERIAKEPPDSENVRKNRERWGRFLLTQGDAAGAEEQFRTILAQQRADRPYATFALAHGGMARLALAAHDVPAALEASASAVDAFAHVSGRYDVRSGPYLWLIRAEALQLSGDAPAAREWAQRALDASRRYDDPAAPSIAQAQAQLRAATGTAAQ